MHELMQNKMHNVNDLTGLCRGLRRRATVAFETDRGFSADSVACPFHRFGYDITDDNIKPGAAFLKLLAGSRWPDAISPHIGAVNKNNNGRIHI